MSDNYSIVCKRCGRKLKSEVSRNRGYGSYCYSKIAKDQKKDNNRVEEMKQAEQIEGQLNIENISQETKKAKKAKNMKIKFIEVGRNNKTWTAEYKEEYGDIRNWIIRQASKCLVSSNIGFYVDEKGKGSIYAGFHIVGELQLL